MKPPPQVGIRSTNLFPVPSSNVWINISQRSKTIPTFCSLPQYPRIAQESPFASGGKFWLGVAMETGISVRWGKLGVNGTVKHIPITQCKNKNPVLELKHRLQNKMNNGYNIIPHETVVP